jgi:hypothetical protein
METNHKLSFRKSDSTRILRNPRQAVLANATAIAAGATIHDSKGDNLTLTGFTHSMIAAAASQFHFA